MSSDQWSQNPGQAKSCPLPHRPLQASGIPSQSLTIPSAAKRQDLRLFHQPLEFPPGQKLPGLMVEVPALSFAIPMPVLPSPERLQLQQTVTFLTQDRLQMLQYRFLC